MSDETESSTDASDTYAQIVVPSYDLQDPVAVTTTQTGSSFLRLGSFPSLTDTAEQPSGFANSLTLANLVGDATSLATSEASDDLAPAALMDENDYAGDSACYLLGFTDDTRVRPSDGTLYVDWTSVSDTTTVRKAETARLLTKGGWWVHSDGNRVTTTCGDKIEVIQGNYKLVVLGRAEPSSSDGNAAIFDMSGGHCVDQDAAPNANVMCVEYAQQDGVWTVLEDNGSGNLTEKFHGKLMELYTGSKKESYVGKPPGSYDGNLTQTPDDGDDPVITDKTWAQSISTYVGSDGKPVPSIYTYTAAGAINDVTFASEVTSTTTAVLVLETTVGVKVEIAVVGTEISGAKYEYIGIKDVVTEANTEVSDLKTELHTLKEAVSVTSNLVGQNVLRIADVDERITDVETDLVDTSLKIKNAATNLSDTVTNLSNDVNTLAEMIFMG